jgi:methylmalonyl-CoA mutase N-terminal domain/subunit
MEETDLTNAIDPFNGSFLVENMTNQMIREIELELKSIDEIGGALQGIHTGYQIGKIEMNAFLIARKIEDSSRKVVGLNYAKSESSIFTDSGFIQAVDNGIIETFNKYKANRDSNKVAASLLTLTEAASSGSALMPVIKENLKVGSTIGEICNALSEAWKEIKL